MPSHSKKVLIIGAGFAGLSAASFLAQKGWQVTVVEKNSLPGGRARKFESNGFVFDMGPSWYWMPDTFERYFAQFGKKVSDYYQLQRLDPSYRVYFEKDQWDIPANYEALQQLLESFRTTMKMTHLFYQMSFSFSYLTDAIRWTQKTFSVEWKRDGYTIESTVMDIDWFFEVRMDSASSRAP